MNEKTAKDINGPIKDLFERFWANKPPEAELDERHKNLAEGFFRIGAAILFEHMLKMEDDCEAGDLTGEQVQNHFKLIKAEVEEMQALVVSKLSKH